MNQDIWRKIVCLKANFNKFNKKRKAFQVTWVDNDSLSSSNDEEATETTNTCFMSFEDEVRDFQKKISKPNFYELLGVFNELLVKFKKERKLKINF